MSKAASEKVLKRMENYLNSEAARAALDMHPQRVWMYHEDIANAFKDGYALVKNRRKKKYTYRKAKIKSNKNNR